MKTKKAEFTKELLDLIKQYEKLTKYHFLPEKSTPKTLWFDFGSGKKSMTSPTRIKEYIDYKTSKRTIDLKDFFLHKPRQLKKEWRHVSASITLDEYTKLEAIAKKNNIKINQIIRSLILKVIEANK